MRNLLLVKVMQIFSKRLIITFAITAIFSGHAHAFKSGHGSVLSDAGAPLQIAIPLLELSADELASIQVRVPEADAWSKLGLTPPVSLETLKVDVVPGFSPGSRRLLISSPLAAQQSPVDVLLDITTSSGLLQVQSSYLVTLPSTQISGVTSESGALNARSAGLNPNVVRPGSTLYSIAQSNAVPGATIYQMLLALFEANPDAFLSENMNLLKAGSVLTIPDADTVKAIDKSKAKKIFQSQVQAFNEIRRKNQIARAAAMSQTQSAQSNKAVKSDAVGSTPTDSKKSDPTDQVRLTSQNSADQKSDARTSAKNEAVELNARIKALQENVDQLKNVNGSPSTTASVQSTAPTSSAPISSAPVSSSNTAASGNLSDSTTSNLSTSTPNNASVQASGTTVEGHSNKDATLTGSSKKSDVNDIKAARTDQSTKERSSFISRLNAIWNKFLTLLVENILFALAAFIAFCALVIAWMMRRAGERNDDETDEVLPSVDHKLSTENDISQKLSNIDLNLK